MRVVLSIHHLSRDPINRRIENSFALQWEGDMGGNRGVNVVVSEAARTRVERNVFYFCVKCNVVNVFKQYYMYLHPF
jgi:hypothetical protein